MNQQCKTDKYRTEQAIELAGHLILDADACGYSWKVKYLHGRIIFICSYYEMPEKTAEDFFEAHGRRWFRSGDIGQVRKHDHFLLPASVSKGQC